MTYRLCQLFVFPLLLTASAFADDFADHSHSPIIVRSRAVIERLPVKVIDPIDVVVNSYRDTLIADRVGKIVFRVDAEQETSVVAKDLAGLERVTDSGGSGIHVLIRATKAGKIVRLLENGFQETVCELAFAPTGLATDSIGNLWTTDSETNKVLRYGADGRLKQTTQVTGITADIAADDFGATVLLNSGKIVAVGADGSKKTIGYVTPSATRIRLTSDGEAIVLAKDSNGKTMLLRPTTKPGTVDRFADTPDGTSAFAFDKLGNLTLANPTFRAVTQVTSHFMVPCPHCGQPVPMLLSPTAPPHEKQTRRSF